MAEDATITVLHFVHGKYEGTEFPLDAESFVAGRSTEADLVLADDAVSRKHARFFAKRGRVWVRDLGSRNGTHVNGKQTLLHCLRPGDRLTIGSSLVAIESKRANEVSSRRTGEQRRRRPNESAGRSMSGSLEDIPLMDVLQWLATSRKTGALKVKDPEAGRIGALHLREGKVFYAAIDGNGRLHPEKALMRMLNWQKGMFELESASLQDPPVTLNLSLEHMLMEAARQQDELANLAKKRPMPGAKDIVRLAKPSPARWKELPPEQIDLVQDIVEQGGWQAVLDASPTDDVTLFRALTELRAKGVVTW
jgi:pSer/pThr/pTyr-binding forkhead associated (FHA) protein